MFGHRSFLIVGSAGAADILSLMRGGHELIDCEFSFEQGIDDRGKAETKVYAGIIHLTLPVLPPVNIIEWALQSRKYCFFDCPD